MLRTLLTNSIKAAAILLGEAAQHANRQGYRGVVIENPTLLDADAARTLGIMPTRREMVLTIRTPLQLPNAIPTFALDVK